MTNTKSNFQDMAALRKQFIKNINPNNLDSIDWADVTIAFDKEVMTEIFWGIEDDKTLKSVVKAIINTWNKLYKAKDRRCMENENSGSFVSSIDAWKFGGLFKESIDDFFANLWVRRNAQNTYLNYGGETDSEKSNINVEREENESKKEIETLKKENANLRADIEKIQKWVNDNTITEEQLNEIFPLENDSHSDKPVLPATSIVPDNNLQSQLLETQNEIEDIIMELLTDICEKDENSAREFYNKVRESSDQDIPNIVLKFKSVGKIAKNRSNHSIWIVLHAAKLYGTTESNFNTAIRKRTK